MNESLIPRHGGYRQLKSFQVAQLVYDVTIRFCDRYVDRRSRTVDQMVQAARSGTQNIAEGSKASGTSKKTELKLTNVARASLEELRLDYEDFLRHRRLPVWEYSDPRRRDLIARRCTTADDVAAWFLGQHEGARRSAEAPPRTAQAPLPAPFRHPIPAPRIRSTPSIASMPSMSPPARLGSYPELAANAALTLIAVACSLLDRQIDSLAAAFFCDGGFTERLYRTRAATRR